MTVAEIATVLKLNQQTVRNWITDGLLPVVRVGRRALIKRSDFDAMIEAGYTGRRKRALLASMWSSSPPIAARHAG